MTRAELEKLSEEELDIFVHDRKGDEAASINNSGKTDQIDYLLGTKQVELLLALDNGTWTTQVEEVPLEFLEKDSTYGIGHWFVIDSGRCPSNVVLATVYNEDPDD